MGLSHDQAAADHVIDGYADGAPIDAQVLSEPSLGGEPPARLEVAGVNLLRDYLRAELRQPTIQACIA